MAKKTFNVNFNNASIGDSAASIGIKVPRSEIDLDTADGYFVKRRLNLELKLGSDGDQARIPGAGQVVAAVADVNSFGVQEEWVTCTLSFSRKELDVTEISNFAKRSGTMKVKSSGDIPDAPSASKEEGTDAGSDDVMIVEDGKDWRRVKLDRLFDGALLATLKKGGYNSVGPLAKLFETGGSADEIVGIGGTKAEFVRRQFDRFLEVNGLEIS